MQIIDIIKAYLAKQVIKQPYMWSKAWTCLNTFTFLLPHEQSYWGLQHFCTSCKDMFLDIGANSGISALSFRKISSKIFPSIPILSIEPNIFHQKALTKLEKKIPNFSFVIQGMGSAIEDLCFYTPVYKGIVLHTFTSLNKSQVYTAIKETFGAKICCNLTIEENIAHVGTIDSMNVYPSIIKIDTEGNDYQVLLGAQKTLSKLRPFCMVEACWASYGDIESFFKENHYGLFRYHYKEDTFVAAEQNKISHSQDRKNIFAIPSEKISWIRANVIS